MALFAIDGDVGCLFSLLTFFLGMQKESKSPSEGETKANSKPMNKGIRSAVLDTRSGSGMTRY
jgi:hypothetical protein